MSYNITIKKGTDFSRSFAVSESQIATDITGYTFEGTLKERYTSTDSVSFTMTTIQPPEQGIFQASLTDTITSQMDPGTWVYDIVMTTDSGDKIRILEGNAFISQGVTP